MEEKKPAIGEMKSDITADVEEKVMAYLTDRGVDLSTISVKDIDEKSLLLLAEYAERSEQEKIADTAAVCKECCAPPVEKIVDDDAVDVDVDNPQKPRCVNEGPEKPSEPDCSRMKVPSRLVKNEHIERSNILPVEVKNSVTHYEKKKIEKGEKEFDFDYGELEPWQKAIFYKLDEQTKAIKKCQEQMDLLTKIVTSGNSIPYLESNVPTQAMGPTSIAPTDQSTHRQPAPVRMDPAQNVPRNPVAAQEDMAILSLFERTFERMLQYPRNTYNYVTTSRPFRIYFALRHEADNFHIPGNRDQRFFDIHLMFKLSFICLFLRARMGSSGRRDYKKSDGSLVAELMAMWRNQSATLLLVASIFVYLIQTGFIVFLYRILFKDHIVGDIMRNKDLEESEEAVAREAAADADARVVPARRGRRDHVLPVQNHVGNPNENNPDNQNGIENRGDAGDGQGAERVEPNRFRGFGFNVNLNFVTDETFFGGVIDPPFDEDDELVQNIAREEIVLRQMIEVVKSFFCFFGSFFLSFLPMWRPRVREVVRPPRGGDNRSNEYDDSTDNENNENPNNDAIQV